MKKTPLLIIGIAAIALALIAGFYYGGKQGKKDGEKSTEEKLKPLIDIAFPKPADEIKNLTGVIKGVYGAQIDFEMTAIDDYLPHTDGTPQEKETRTASISKNTIIVLVSLDKQGNLKEAPVKLSELKVGDTITARSAANIREVKKFDATKIELLKY